MSAAARAVGNFFGVGSKSDRVIQQWKTLAERKLKDGSYGLHMNQSIHLGKSSREKMVARADKVLNTISMSLMRDKQEEEEEEEPGEEEDSHEEEADRPVDSEDIQVTEQTVEDQQPVPSGDMELQLVKEREMSEETTEKVDTTTKSSDTTALDQTEKEIEPQEEPLTKDDLIYGKAAFKHYKFFTMIENKRKVAELKERLEEKITEYDWKLEAIDELVNLARAYYNNPHSEQGAEWRSLKRKVQRRSQRRKVSQTIIRHELSKLPKFKPIFTYMIITLQVITFAVLCTFGGITDIGVEPQLSLTTGIKTFLGLETIHKWTPPNIWIGPDQRFFIGVGALYPPCMREDYSVQLQYSQRNFSIDNPLGCCEIANRNTAGTTTEHECSHLTGGVGSWRAGTPCGERRSGEKSVAHLLKPCCVDLKGTCELVSHAHCIFIGGVFHRTGPEHCSQVNCLAEICKMGHLESSSDRPWIPANPNQWWRLPLSLFYHQGIVHIAMVTVIQWLIMRQIEQTAGWFRMVLIYSLSGIGGLLTSSLFEPDVPAVGGVSSVFGMIGVMLVELSQFWPSVKKPVHELIKIILVITVFLGLGTLPYLDNFGIITGLIIGMLCAVILLPYVTFRRWQVKIRLILVIAALPSLFLIMFVLFYAFYKVQTFEACRVCKLINCVPYTETMCNSSLWTNTIS